MLTIDGLTALQPTLEEQSNKRIIATPGTTVSAISEGLLHRVKTALAINLPHDQEEKTLTDLLTLISNVSYDNYPGYQTQEALTNGFIEKITETVRNNIYITRNIVLPLIDEYTERLNTVANRYINLAGLALTINEDKKLFIFEEPQIVKIIRDNSTRKLNNAFLPRYHKPLAVEEIKTYLSTGDKSFDEFILEWIELNNLDELLQEVYDDIFKALGGSDISYDKYITTDNYIVALLSMLLAWGLANNPQEGIRISYDDYKHRMTVFANVCAFILNMALNNYNRAIEHKQLVLAWPSAGREYAFESPQGNSVLVHPKVYSDFLSMGGTPEIIFGSYLTDRSTLIHKMIEKQDQYHKAYQKAIKYGKLANSNNLLAGIKKELRIISTVILSDIIESQTDVEAAYIGRIQIAMADKKQKVEDFLYRLNSNQIENIYLLVRKFICSIYFDDSEAETLLRKMEYLDPEGTMDVNDLAIIASVEFIVDWLFTQVEINPTGIALENYMAYHS